MRHYFVAIAPIALALSLAVSAQEPASTRTVTGHQIGHYKNGPVPVDLSTETVAALIPSGSSYTVLAGTGTSAGTFSIPNVPTGFFWLRLGAGFVWTQNSVVNADYNAAYRSTAVAANSSTQMTVDFTNVNPYQTTDFLEMFCPNNLSWEYYLPTPSPGQTTIAGTFPYTGNLSDAALLDKYYVAQLATQTVGGLPFDALSRYFSPARFTQTQGSDVTVKGAMKTIPQTHALELNLNAADMNAQALAANPGATVINTGFALDVYPGSLSKGVNTTTPDLVVYAGTGLTSNMDFGTIAYGNPYPATWPVYVLYSYFTGTSYLAPGASNPGYLYTVAQGYTPTLPSTTSPFSPLVGVVQSPSINGMNFFSDLTGIGLTPELQWSAPAVGTATFYTLSIYNLQNSGGYTAFSPVAAFATQKTSVRIPSGLLSSGNTYVFKVDADYVEGLVFSAHPNFLGPTSGIAEIVSGTAQP